MKRRERVRKTGTRGCRRSSGMAKEVRRKRKTIRLNVDWPPRRPAEQTRGEKGELAAVEGKHGERSVRRAMFHTPRLTCLSVVDETAITVLVLRGTRRLGMAGGNRSKNCLISG